MQVRDWSDGKERNIRALLTSLKTVLWEGEDKWSGVEMHELVQANQVSLLLVVFSVRKRICTRVPYRLYARTLSLVQTTLYKMTDQYCLPTIVLAFFVP